jgi:hypothetical protein
MNNTWDKRIRSRAEGKRCGRERQESTPRPILTLNARAGGRGGVVTFGN